MAVVWKRDVAEEVAKKYKSGVLDGMKGFFVSLDLDDKTLDLLEKDKTGKYIAQRMVEDAQDECAKTVELLAAEAKKLDNECKDQTAESIEKRRFSFGAMMESKVKALAKQVEVVPEKRFDKWKATQSEWKKYKFMIGVKVVMGTLGALKVGFAIAAAVPTGGASLAYALVKGVQEGGKIIQEIGKVASEAETVQKNLLKKLQAAKDTVLKTKNKAVNTGIDIASQTLNNLLSVDLMPTAAVLKADCELWKQKLAHLEVKAVAGSKLALETLDQASELEKKFKAAQASNFKNAGKILESLTKVRTNATKFLEICGTLGNRVTEGEKAYTIVATKTLPALLSKQYGYKMIFDSILPLAAAAVANVEIVHVVSQGPSALAIALASSTAVRNIIDAS